MHARAVLWLTMAGCLSLSCLDTPTSKSVVDPGTKKVHFAGEAPYRLGPNEPINDVVIQVKASGGSWHTLTTTKVSKKATFDVTVTVPEKYWLDPCGIATFRLRTNPGDIAVKALDDQCVAALGPNPTDQQKNTCKTEVVEVQRESSHTGDVSIVGDGQAKAYRCLTRIEGNLSIATGASLVLSLPRLREVTGGVSVTLDKAKPPSSQSPPPKVAVLELPLLKRVGGALALTMANAYGSTKSSEYWNFGLEALTHVGGDISLTNPMNAGAHTSGLLSLSQASKSVIINWQVSDYWEVNFGPNLARIKGDLELNAPNVPILQNMFPKLSEVDGNLRIKGKGRMTAFASLLPELATVGKDLLIDGFSLESCQRGFAKLAKVSGRLDLENGVSGGYIGTPQSLTLGGLIVSKDGTRGLPFKGKVKVADAGTVKVVDNAALCQCQVDAFVSELQQNGWSGTPDMSGNKNDATCSGCPGLECP